MGETTGIEWTDATWIVYIVPGGQFGISSGYVVMGIRRPVR